MKFSMKYPVVLCLCVSLVASAAWSQAPDDKASGDKSNFGEAANLKATTDIAGTETSSKPKPPIPNPFEQPTVMAGGEMEDDMGMDMSMDMAMGMSMGMGDMGGMEMDMEPSADELFRVNLSRAIAQLKKAKTDEERAVLQKYIREAFEQRYDRMMTQRKEDIQRLSTSLTALQRDLKRRIAAKDRVIGLQLQSVQLAAEDLLDLNDLQGMNENRGRDVDGGGQMGGG